MILDDDESYTGSDTDGATDDVHNGRVARDKSPHETLVISELALELVKPIDKCGLWYDVEDGCYIDEPAPGLGPCESKGVPPALPQDQAQILLQSCTPLQDQINQQDTDVVTQSVSLEPAPFSLFRPSNNGDDGGTNDGMAELEEELGWTLEEQVKSTSASAPTPSNPRSVEALPDEIQTRRHSETTGSRQEEPQEVSQHGIGQGFEEGEQWKAKVVGEGKGVSKQQQERLAAQEEEPGLLGVDDQQDLVEVVIADDSEDKEAFEALPVAQPKNPEIDEHCFRLRGIRARHLAGRHTKTTQYRVRWGRYPNRSDSWLNRDDVRISMPRPPCKLYSQNPATLQAEMDISRVYNLRSIWCEGRKTLEYLVEAFGLDARTWITEDQLRVSLSPTLAAELRGN
jgi:hypothetical protein